MPKMVNAILILVIGMCMMITMACESMVAASERQITILYGHNIHGQVNEAG